jgi:intein/homing endonuclease
MNILLTKEKLISTYRNTKLGFHYANKHSYLFPLRASPLLAGLVADITGDGHLGRGLIQFISKDKSDAARFKKNFDLIFKHKSRIRISPSTKKTWECLIGSNTLYRIFALLEVPVGYKTVNKFGVPKWIKNGSKEIKKEYLQRIFTCEGSVRFQNSRRIIIKFEMLKDEKILKSLEDYLQEIKNMLLEFDVKTTNLMFAGSNIRKDGRKSIGLSFEIQGTAKNFDSMLSFYREINFDTSLKKKKLKRYLSALNAPVS